MAKTLQLELTPCIQRLRNRFHLQPADFEPALPAALFLRGSLFFSDDGINPVHLEQVGGRWVFQDRWSDGYREAYINFEERAIFTACEGDLDLTVDADPEQFEARLLAAEAFYQGVRNA